MEEKILERIKHITDEIVELIKYKMEQRSIESRERTQNSIRILKARKQELYYVLELCRAESGREN